jgi:16S rRNA C967 or C1407 C5-methylase (RsmB/RsmF family)/NOL1/NOP2/fmu family ribosome biogenesis protein
MLPHGLIKSLENVAGFDKQAFERVHEQSEIITSVRYNSNKKSQENFVGTSSVSWCNQGIYLENRPSFVFDPLWHAGAYYVQEASSMFLWHICKSLFNTDTQKLVLDLCAAPGGKTTLLSDYFKDGLVVSNEVIKPRAAILQENTTKWGSNNIVITNNDAEHFKPLSNLFDAVFVDAPCSGSGLFRKDKEAINEWSENNVDLCQQRQKRILSNIIDTLKKDGYLIYSTCSYSLQENEAIADWLLDNFELDSVTIPLATEWGIVATTSQKHNALGYRFYPNLVKGEGFFVTVFKKKNGSTSDTLKTTKTKKITLANKQEISIAQLYVQQPELISFVKHNENIIATPLYWQTTLEILANHLYLKKIGTAIGQIKHHEIIPSHDLAVSIIKSNLFPSIEVDKETAIKFLQRKDIQLTTQIKGWVILCYCEVSIGFVKVLPNRANNYYPKEWRILKDYF